jgi:hypothetical protein
VEVTCATWTGRRVCELLGGQDVFRANDTYGISACAVFEPQSRTVLAFTQHREEDPPEFDPRRAGLDHLSFVRGGRPGGAGGVGGATR